MREKPKNLYDKSYEQGANLKNLGFDYHEEDIFKTVDLVKPQIIALGYDQTHQEKFITEGCKKIDLDVTVARLESPRPETSSSKIQKEYGKEIHGL